MTISIHALLAESDNRVHVYEGMSMAISIHALLAESDPVDIRTLQALKIFLSTLSLRRATTSFNICVHHTTFLSTLSLRRATSN